MKNRFELLIILLVGLSTLGCQKDTELNDPVQNPANGTSVETNPPNTNYVPAFAGQTRVNKVNTSTPYQTRLVTSSLIEPWGVAALPDGRLLVTEKSGFMRIVNTNGVVGQPITGIQEVNSNGQGGLLGICIDPQFATNRMVYWVFSETVSGGSITAVAKGRLSNNETTIENSTVIYRANPAANSTSHYGGRILFDLSGHLLVSCGERSILSTRPSAQLVNTALGKIVRITTNGTPAPNNILLAGTLALPELYSIGHRNPQGLAIHPTTGELWQSEHGPSGGDEINRVLSGHNYGWPVITYGIEYSGQTIGAGIQQREDMEQPVYYWDPVISPSGMTFYRGNRIPEWQNNLFVGALSGRHIARLVILNNRVVGEERLLTSENQRFRDITQGADEALYAITDGGRLYRIDRQ